MYGEEALVGREAALVSMDARSNNSFFDSEPGGREAVSGPLALVQAFVNTAASEGERRWEAIGDPGSLRSWLARRGLLAEGVSVEDADVGRARGSCAHIS